MNCLKKILFSTGCIFAAVNLLTSCNNGYEEYDMVDPPRPKSTDAQAFPGYFVKVDGTGSGTSWDDAMSGGQLFTMLANNSIKKSADIYMAAGTYKVGKTSSSFISIGSAVNIHGGYNPASTGYTTSISYPSAFETIISGDINGDGIANNGDARLVEVTSIVPVTFSGITFKGGYLSTSTHSDASGANISVRPGITILNGGSVNMEYCNIEDCVSEITGGSDAGGAGLYISNGIMKMNKCVMKGNKADNRGGAIRLFVSRGHDTKLYMNNCLFTDNGIKGDFGGAIHVSGACDVFMNNCTLVNNYAKFGGAGINSGGRVVMMNSTLANNICTNGTNGHEIRCEGVNNWFLMNNIIVESAGRSTDASPSICMNGADKTIVSGGYNLISFIGGTGTFTRQGTDKISITYNKVFGSASLEDNDGYPKTLALPNSRYAAAPLNELQSYASKNLLIYNVGVDQRSLSRKSQKVCPGAYEYLGENDGKTVLDGNLPDLNVNNGHW